jgi:hypothetical protein
MSDVDMEQPALEHRALVRVESAPAAAFQNRPRAANANLETARNPNRAAQSSVAEKSKRPRRHIQDAYAPRA